MSTILVVDDSETARYALRKALERDPELLVIAEASDGAQAQALAQRFDPDVITMDVYLERENGLELTEQLLAEAPRRIIVVTAVNPSDPQLAYQALEAGALDVLPKPPAPTSAAYADACRRMNRVVRSLSTVPIARRRGRHVTAARVPEPPVGGGGRLLAGPPKPALSPKASATTVEGAAPTAPPNLIVIGASTGGPPVVRMLLSALPAPFPIPIVVIQHISVGFAAGFARWLGESTRHKLQLVTRPVRVEPGCVYVAPDDRNLEFAGGRTLTPVPAAPDSGIVPSIDVCLVSAASMWQGGIAAVQLTGMGSDGVVGVEAISTRGAYCIAQSPATCVVSAMPGKVIERGLAQAVLVPREIPARLCAIVGAG